MNKFFAIVVFSFLISCGTSEIIVPEGTDPQVAQVMTTYHLQKPKAEKLIESLDNQSGLNEVKLSDISSVQESVIRGRRVLIVYAGNKKLYVNLD